MNVILLGYRGCGKSTLGKLLADQVWKTFVDTDSETCARFANDSVAEIWKEHGEKAWRKAEAEVTREVCGKSDTVIALGGGALIEPATRKTVKDAAESVRIYLLCEPAVLYRRITDDTRSAAMRPALTEHQGTYEEVKRVLMERDPVYRDVADKVFDVTHLDPKNAVRYLIDRCL